MTHIQQRRDTAANWTISNPVLFEGELGWEKDADPPRAKMGDGVTPWNSLDYVNISPPVLSVAGKTGAVSLAVADVSGAAPTASPTFTGNPHAPTPVETSNDETVATTEFVKAQGYAKLNGPNFVGNPTAPTPSTSDNDTSLATTAFVKAAIAAAILNFHPVDSLYFTATNINPGTFLGGTWAQFGAGRVLVGVDTGQVEFDTAGETGGEKRVTLKADETGVPYTNMVQQSNGGPLYFNVGSDADSTHRAVYRGKLDAAQSHNNLQPYITGYMWRRTA